MTEELRTDAQKVASDIVQLIELNGGAFSPALAIATFDDIDNRLVFDAKTNIVTITTEVDGRIVNIQNARLNKLDSYAIFQDLFQTQVFKDKPIVLSTASTTL